MRVTGRTHVTHITSYRTARVCLKGYIRSQTLQALIFYVDGLTNTWQFASFKCSCSGVGDGTTLLLGSDVASHRLWSQTFRRQLVVLFSRIWTSTKNDHEELQTVEDKIIMVFRNVVNLIPGDTASHSRRTDNAFLSADYIKPCSRNDPQFNDCALKSGREAIPSIIRGNLHTCTLAHLCAALSTVLSAAYFGENQIQQKTLVYVLIRMRS